MTARAYPWPVHPAALLLPEMPGGELRELADDIAAHGLREPVRLYREAGELTLLDGRSRVLACALAGVPVRTCEWEGADPAAYAVSLNVRRRHLTPGQRALLGTRLEELYAAEAAARRERSKDPMTQRFTSSGPSVQDCTDGPDTDYERRSATRAAAVVGSSGRAVATAKRIEAKAPDLAEQVRAGDMTLSAADDALRRRVAAGEAPARQRAARQPLPAFADRAGWELRRAVDRVQRVLADDRFGANRAQVAAALLPHLGYAADIAATINRQLTAQGEHDGR